MRILPALLVFAGAALAQDGATRADWNYHGGTQYAWRYSALDQINRNNVSKLAPVWAFQTGDYEMGLQSTPIVIGGKLYLSTSRSQVFALDAATGRLIWQFKYPLPRATVPYGPQNRGIAVGGGYVLLATYDDYLIAIDENTGQEAWRVSLDDMRQCGCTVTGAPLVVKDKVIVGGAGGDSAHRGYLTAIYLKTGRVAWRFYTIPGPGEKGHETWKGDSWKFGGGATWMTGSFDPALNLVYWGVGNAAADNDARARYSGVGEGANLYTASVVALDADTGKLKWYHQEIPKDVWDFDSSYECVLIDREVRGQMRKLLVHINKGGYAFVLDRVTGEYINGYPIVDNHNWTTGLTEDGKFVGRVEPVEGKTTLFCPSPFGGKSWNETTYSPRTGFLYTPTLEVCADEAAVSEEPHEGRNFIGGTWKFTNTPSGPAHSHLDAYDPVTGKRQWSYPYKYMLLASLLATGGDVLFTGDPEGFFFALDARTGTKLWSFQTGSGHRGSSVTYMVNGRQYVATPSGWGSLASGSFPDLWPETATFRGGSTLTVFALPEAR
ncbi:MAG TPA: PQQ-dependent dehydrogenase, methanol/ethanol family [Bryobacteraceae bacterium]|nr:PQQ-dependent dehydrogenase, methanol/ethanol family [Bryobacteraceae bacterium]